MLICVVVSVDSDDEVNNELEIPISTGGWGGSTSTFFFRPGGTEEGNVYTSWSTLMAALPAPAYVIIDDSLEDPHITAGSWDLGGVQLQGTFNNSVCTPVTIDNGALITGALHAMWIHFTNEATTAAPFDEGGERWQLNNCRFTSTGTKPFIHFSTAATGIGGGADTQCGPLPGGSE